MRTRRLRVSIVGVAIVAYAWWVAGLDAFTVTIHLALAPPVVAVFVLALRTSARRRSLPGGGPPSDDDDAGGLDRGGGVTPPVTRWVAVSASLTAVQLYALASGAGKQRSQRPTISWLADQIDLRPGVAALFVAWVAAGWYLARR